LLSLAAASSAMSSATTSDVVSTFVCQSCAIPRPMVLRATPKRPARSGLVAPRAQSSRARLACSGL
jgi:hypothetical protein